MIKLQCHSGVLYTTHLDAKYSAEYFQNYLKLVQNFDILYIKNIIYFFLFHFFFSYFVAAVKTEQL